MECKKGICPRSTVSEGVQGSCPMVGCFFSVASIMCDQDICQFGEHSTTTVEGSLCLLLLPLLPPFS